jgi:hypothetical protein
LPYQTSSFGFNDVAPAHTVQRARGNGRASSNTGAIPPELLNQIRISPRDALKATAAEYAAIFGRTRTSAGMWIMLVTEPPEGSTTPTPWWRITYINSATEQRMELWVDARNGTVSRLAD